MILFLAALLIIGPIAEIYVLLSAAGVIGVWSVIGACIGTAVLGGVLLRLEGLAALRAAQADMAEGRVPVEAAVDAIFLILTAPLLMTPGFITDAIGFLLLVPPLRHWIAREALRRIRRSIERGDAQVYIRRY